MQNKARMLFKQIKAGIKKWQELDEEELQLMLTYYPSLFPCEYKEDGVPCGFPSYVIIVTDDNKYCACKVHYVKLTLQLLHKGNRVKWIKKLKVEKGKKLIVVDDDKVVT